MACIATKPLHGFKINFNLQLPAAPVARKMLNTRFNLAVHAAAPRSAPNPKPIPATRAKTNNVRITSPTPNKVISKKAPLSSSRSGIAKRGTPSTKTEKKKGGKNDNLAVAGVGIVALALVGLLATGNASKADVETPAAAPSTQDKQETFMRKSVGTAAPTSSPASPPPPPAAVMAEKLIKSPEVTPLPVETAKTQEGGGNPGAAAAAVLAEPLASAPTNPLLLVGGGIAAILAVASVAKGGNK